MWSLYGYVQSSPIKTLDPSGKIKWPDNMGNELHSKSMSNQGSPCCRSVGMRWEAIGFSTELACIGDVRAAVGFGFPGAIGAAGSGVAATLLGLGSGVVATTGGGFFGTVGLFYAGHSLGTMTGAKRWCNALSCTRYGKWRCFQETTSFWSNYIGAGCPTKCEEWRSRD